MNLVFQSADLKRLVKKLAPVQSEHTVLDPVKGRLHATDPDLTVLVEDESLKAADAEDLDGHVSLNSKQFSSVVNRTSGEVSLSIISGRVIIKSKRSVFELPTANPKLALPPVPAAKYTLPLKPVGEILSFAASACESRERHNFTGAILLTAKENTLRAVGTDHRRLALAECVHNGTILPDFSLLIPSVVVPALRGLESEQIAVSEDAGQIFLSASLTTENRELRTTLIARKLVKPFSKYEHLLIKTPKFQAEIDAEAMKESLKQVSPMLEEDDNGLRRLRLQFGDTLQLFAASGLAKAHDELEYIAVIPDPMFDTPSFEVKLDHRALEDYFAAVQGKVLFESEVINSVMMKSGSKWLLLATLK